MGIVQVRSLDGWFTEALGLMGCSAEAKAYVAGVLKTQARPPREDVLSDRSVVIAYRDAEVAGDFAAFQRIGDWVLWAESFVPRSIDGLAAFDRFGRLAYLRCHSLTRGAWQVYEELSTDLPRIVAHVRSSFDR